MASSTGLSGQSVLEAPPPRFASDQVSAIASKLFGLGGRAINLGSERDQTFLIDDDGRGAVLKISNSGEDPSALDLELEAILHIARVDPALPVARPRAVAGTGPAAYRPTVAGPDGAHFVRLFERLEGRTAAALDLDDGALRDYGETHARVSLALRSFFHPAAGRELLWDLKHASRLRPLLRFIPDSRRRALVEAVLDRYDSRVVPAWGSLRAQVVHGDLTLDNVLVDDLCRIVGIVDFGDATYTAQVADLAVGLTSLMCGRAGDDVFRSARLAIDGYEAGVPLEPGEFAVLGDLVAARLAAHVTISAWRVERYPENADYIQAWDAGAWALLELFADCGADAVARELGGPRPYAATAIALAAPAPRPGLRASRPHLPPARARRPWRGRVAVRCRRLSPARRVQQRPRGRPLPSARDRGRRPADPRGQHTRPVSLRATRRTGRAPRGIYADELRA